MITQTSNTAMQADLADDERCRAAPARRLSTSRITNHGIDRFRFGCCSNNTGQYRATTHPLPKKNRIITLFRTVISSLDGTAVVKRLRRSGVQRSVE
ncbi:hypothetical protein [Paraburkholderia elongata]|uniref:Uncharacterized protein n=1 Tax=Paraburkholderia elongata TaxID=2675747 RepID=A0A972NVD3_9BURK|nr:hypothetical protein [Paraburkholderia elongata]NPT59791.1 hypothetical protein [Paraburkholderia elongata]